jgi:ubiquinone/menaquinone biosynthesis C-methylase UbiE
MHSVSLNLSGARRILDFGCGDGRLSANAFTEDGACRVGIDCSFESMRRGSQLDSVRFVLANGLHLPFADATFDCVVGHVSMPYMNTRSALREISRVLVPGGGLFLTFHSFHYLRSRLLKSLRLGNWKDVLFMFYVACNGLLNHFSLPQTQLWWKRSVFETVHTPSGASKAAYAAGFQHVSTERAGPGIFFVMTASKPDLAPNSVLPRPG